MIFVTVGSQMPFRRLVQAVDEWAQRNPTVEVLAQIGRDGTFQPVALHAFESVPPARYAELVQASDLVVAHAGMGSVLTARNSAASSSHRRLRKNLPSSRKKKRRPATWPTTMG